MREPGVSPRWVLLAMLGWLLATPGFLTAGTTGKLSGLVVDDEGSPLPGVSVTVGSPAQIGGLLVKETDTSGVFQYPRLAPGAYTVRIELDGFATHELNQVEIRVDHSTRVQVILPLGVFGEGVEVTETTPVIDLEQVSTGQTFNAEYIRQTASSMEDLMLQTAGVSPDNPRRMLGSTPQDNSFLLDGLDATNWYQRSPSPPLNQIPFDAVKEVALHTAGFEAEYGQATGGVVNLVTRSGGNAYTGTVDLRYTDSGFESRGDHYDPEHQVSELQRLSATLGGPILRDRLWFFSAYSSVRDQTTPTGSPTTREDREGNYLGKLTWQLGTAWKLTGFYSSAPQTQENANASPFVAPEANSWWDHSPSLASLDLVGVLTPSLLWDFRLSHQRWDQTKRPTDGDLDTIGHFVIFSGESFGNIREHGLLETRDDRVETDLTWFVDKRSGSHELKAGLGYGRPEFGEDRCWTGSGRACTEGDEGYFFTDADFGDGIRLPVYFDVSTAEGRRDYSGAFEVAYAQDTWRLGPSWTLKLGLRWDHVAYDDNDGEIAEVEMFQPRLGVAWDATGDGRTLVRASWGRFMHPGNLIMASFSGENDLSAERWCAPWVVASFPAEVCPLEEFGHRTDPEGWSPAGWLGPYSLASEPLQVSEDLEAAYADEVIIGIERELFRRTSVELSYLRKGHARLYDDTCNGNLPDPSLNAECDFMFVTNLPQAKLDYQGWMLRLESRARDWFHLFASWVYSDSKGSMTLNTGFNSDFDQYPYHFENRYGYLPDHSRHRVKISGYATLPWDFALAVTGWWDSELRWTPVTDDPSQVPGIIWGELFLEPRGSRKTGSRSRLDLQLSKGVRIGPTRLDLLGRVINLLDSEAPSEICEYDTGCGDFEMGDAIAWQQPRRYEVGLRVEF